MVMTLYVLACVAVVLLLVLSAAGKVRASERATMAMFAAINLCIVCGIVLVGALSQL